MKVITKTGLELKIDRSAPLIKDETGVGYLSTDGQWFAKLLYEEIPDQKKTITSVVEQYQSTRNWESLKPLYSSSLSMWPQDMIVSPVPGVISNPLPSNCECLLDLLNRQNTKPSDGSYQQWHYRIRTAWQLSQAVAVIHQLGFLHSTLSIDKIWVNPFNGNLCLLGLDQLMPQRSPFNKAGNLEKNMIMSQFFLKWDIDLYILPILIYQLLFVLTQICKIDHFYDLSGTEIMKTELLLKRGSLPLLGKYISDLFDRVFMNEWNSKHLPSPLEWQQALGYLSERLVKCVNANCEAQYYPVQSGIRNICPFCQTPFFRRKVPILRLYEWTQGGLTLVPDFWIVGHPKKALYHWHAVKSSDPNPIVKPAPIAEFFKTDAGWFLLNKTRQPLEDLTSQGVPIHHINLGQSLELKSGTIFRFGTDKQARVGLIQWLC